MRTPDWRPRLALWMGLAVALFVAWYSTPAPLALFTDAAPVGANGFETARQFSRVATGSYTGSGRDNRRVTVGFQPDFVIVKGGNNAVAAARTSSMTGDLTKGLVGANALGADAIQSLDADGFTIGTNAAVNTGAIAYHWMAFQAFPGRLDVSSYQGNGSGQSITGLRFSPEYVIVMSAGADETVHRSSTMSDPFRFDSTAAGADSLNSLDADGFTVGSDAQVNGSGTTYHYVAWKAEPGAMNAGSYTGDALDDRSIADAGFQPQYVIVKSDGGVAACARAVHRPESVTLDNTLNFDGAANFADGIQALEADGFQVGTECSVNAGKTTYHWVAFRDP
jgi:hypothetical protein